MNHHMNFKQRRNGNNKDNTKKLQNVRKSSIQHLILVFHPFSSLVKPILRCGQGLISRCTALNHRFLPVGLVISMGSLEQPPLEAKTDISRVEILVGAIITLTVEIKAVEDMATHLMHNKDEECPALVEVVAPVAMEELLRTISKVVLMVVLGVAGAQI